MKCDLFPPAMLNRLKIACKCSEIFMLPTYPNSSDQLHRSHITQQGMLPPLQQELLHKREFAQRGTHLRALDFAVALGFLLYSAVWRKTTKNALTFNLLRGKIWNFNQVWVLILLSLSCYLVTWYELIKSIGAMCCFPQYHFIGRGNQHGGR